MTRRLLGPTFALVLLLVPAPVEACEADPITEHSPTGVVGCEVYGTGIASMWGGPGVARNDCTWPWTDCRTIAIQSLQTGLVIIVTPTMYGDLYLGDDDPSNDRIVDLDPAAVAALGLHVEEGLWPVRVDPMYVPPVREGLTVLPDTAYNEWRRYELLTVESQTVPVRGAHTFLGRGRLHPRGMRP